MRTLTLIDVRLAALMSLGWLGVAVAEGVSITPGLWTITTTVEAPMLPEPQSKTQTRCVEEAEFDIEQMVGEWKACEVLSLNASSETMTWEMKCSAAEGDASGSGKMTSTGDSAQGSMTMKMMAQGRQMTVHTSWSGNRAGDCS